LMAVTHFHQTPVLIMKLSRITFLRTAAVAVIAAAIPAGAALAAGSQNQGDDKTRVILRLDDIGFCHSVNMACNKLMEAGVPFSASVMTPCPWFEEAVTLLKAHPEVSVGVHLVLFSEWKGYRWGPVLGKEAVPSLVNEEGYFFHDEPSLKANKPEKREIEMEFRAQIDRALASGLRIDYIDTHLGSTKGSREVVRKLSGEYGLPVSGTFDVEGISTYEVPYDRKKEAAVEKIRSLESGKTYRWVIHIGMDTPEMCALEEIRTSGLPEMCRHRNAQLNTLLSEEFHQALEQNQVELITYRSFFESTGTAEGD
jgi:predicted glycoside hydrolase/deacetylase ChbG (UPF0249 family)